MDRRGWWTTVAGHNETTKLELSRAWNPWTVHSLHKIVRDQAPTVCFLMETRLNKDGFDVHCRDLPFPNKLILKEPDTGGGLALLWKAEVLLDTINYTHNHILARVTEANGFQWFLTCFYGWADASQKNKSWALLSHVASFVDGPWLCIGEFNAILHLFEKQSRCPPQYKQLDAFREALESCQLADLGFVGYPFTWNNKRPGAANTRERLDRAVANVGWKEKYPASKVIHLFSHASDHLPIILQTKTTTRRQTRGTRGFKFEESWLLWDDCEAIVTEAWNKECGLGSPLVSAKEKIANCGVDLLMWGSSKLTLTRRKLSTCRKKSKSYLKVNLPRRAKQSSW